MSLRMVLSTGDSYGIHRVIDPPGGLPQPAHRLDNDFSRLFAEELLLAVDTLNIDAASFAQMQGLVGKDEAVADLIVATVARRGKQHNDVTGSGGMLVGRVIQVAPGRAGPAPPVGTKVASLVSLTLTPLRIDRIVGVRRASAQVDIEGEAVLFGSSPVVAMPAHLSERLALAVLDVAGAAAQVARLALPGQTIVVLGAGGKSGVLCVAEARRRAGPHARIIGVEHDAGAAKELGALDLCSEVVVADARDPVEVRRQILHATGGLEADLTVSCVNVAGVEITAILATRDRGKVYFFAMSTSFTNAALGAEGVGKDVDLFIGNGYAKGHAEHTLALLDDMPQVKTLFQARYG